MARTFTEDEVRELIEAAMAPLLARIAELQACAGPSLKERAVSRGRKWFF
jgi:hypothetical protein